MSEFLIVIASSTFFPFTHSVTSEEEAMALAEKRFGDVAAMKRAMRGARTHRLYGLAAIAVLALVALWIYDASRPAALPSLPPGMEFVGRPPAVP